MEKREQLYVAVVMLFEQFVLLNYLIAVVDLIAEFLGGIGADLDVVGGARGHNENLLAER